MLSDCATDNKEAAPPSGTKRLAQVDRLRLPGGGFGYPSPFGYLLGPGW